MNAENPDRLRRALQAAEADTSPPQPAWMTRFLGDGYRPDVAVYLAKLLEKLAAEIGEPERSALLAACVGPGTKHERERIWVTFLAAHPHAGREHRSAAAETMSDQPCK